MIKRDSKGRIMKGNVPIYKGVSLPDEVKLKLSKSLKGRKTWNKGKKETRKEVLLRQSVSHFGIKHTNESKRKISEAGKGEKNPNWISDRTKLKKHDHRQSYANSNWRKEVYKRDNWKCKLKSDECKGKIEAHHIFNWVDYPELRFIISNGITLCHYHHPRTREKEQRMIPIFQEIIL